MFSKFYFILSALALSSCYCDLNTPDISRSRYGLAEDHSVLLRNLNVLSRGEYHTSLSILDDTMYGGDGEAFLHIDFRLPDWNGYVKGKTIACSRYSIDNAPRKFHDEHDLNLENNKSIYSMQIKLLKDGTKKNFEITIQQTKDSSPIIRYHTYNGKKDITKSNITFSLKGTFDEDTVELYQMDENGKLITRFY